MTPETPVPATAETVLALIASHGGDLARWPATDRAPAAAIIAGDAQLAAALAKAQRLDGLLHDWASVDIAMAPIDIAAIVENSQSLALLSAAPGAHRPARRSHRWVVGGGMAIAASLSILLMTPDKPRPATPIAQASTPTAAIPGDARDGDAAFAYVFTPTVEEDELI